MDSHPINIDAIIAAAAQIPSIEERSDFLDRACAGNRALRLRLEALLAAQHGHSLAGDQREPPRVTAPLPPAPPVAHPSEIIPPPPIAVTPRKPRNRSRRPTPLLTWKSPAIVLTAFGAVAACAVVLAFTWMSRSRQQVSRQQVSRQQVSRRAESPAEVARHAAPVSSNQSSDLQPHGAQSPALQPQVSVDGRTDQVHDGGTALRSNPQGTFVTGPDTNRAEPNPPVTSSVDAGAGNRAAPTRDTAGESDAVVPKGFPVEIPADAKVASTSETPGKSSMVFTSSKSVVDLDRFFLDRLQKRGYEIVFEGITSEETGPQCILHARRPENNRDVVLIRIVTAGGKSSTELVWER